jgi:RimJ/RimL family protein N-acetyltransferase
MKSTGIKNYYSIKRDNKEIGRIQIINGSLPQIEYDLDDEYRNQGIMTLELKNYLESVKDKFPVLSAIVKKDNFASQRVLLKNGFMRFTELRDYFVYLNDLKASKEKKKVMQNILDSGFVKKFKKSLY